MISEERKAALKSCYLASPRHNEYKFSDVVQDLERLEKFLKFAQVSHCTSDFGVKAFEEVTVRGSDVEISPRPNGYVVFEFVMPYVNIRALLEQGGIFPSNPNPIASFMDHELQSLLDGFEGRIIGAYRAHLARPERQLEQTAAEEKKKRMEEKRFFDSLRGALEVVPSHMQFGEDELVQFYRSLFVKKLLDE
jgi:hypothetical protein